MTLAELEERLKGGAIKQRSLIIKADRNTPYDLVLQIMNQACGRAFPWRWRPRRSRDERAAPSDPDAAGAALPGTLLLFAALSFLAHAATFFLFQVDYPSHVSMPLQTPRSGC